VNLLTHSQPEYYAIALRDFALFLVALALVPARGWHLSLLHIGQSQSLLDPGTDEIQVSTNASVLHPLGHPAEAFLFPLALS
jgi:hypothetical protein